MRFFTQKNSLLLFCFVWIALSAALQRRFYNAPPAGHHAWAMADYYALALRYTEPDAHFFTPRTFSLSTPDGITASDLPLPSWKAAAWMSILNTDAPAIYRLITWLVTTLGLIFFFFTLNDLGVNPLRAALLSLGAGLLPCWVYYQYAMMPSPFSFGLFLIGLWGTTRGLSTGKLIFWIAAIVAFSLAALIRKPFVFSLALLAPLFWQIKVDRKTWAIWASGIAVFALWQFYDRYLYHHYGSIFLRELMSPQTLGDGIKRAVDALRKWGWIWISPAHAAWFAALVYFHKETQTSPPVALRLRNYGWWILGAGVFYFILMIRQYADHEYYAIDSFYPALFTGILLWTSATEGQKKLFFIEVGMIAAALFFAYRSQAWYGDMERFKASENTFRAYDEAGALLDEIKAAPDARLMIFEAFSENRPLVGIRRKGYCLKSSSREEQEKYLAKNPDFVLCLDSLFVSEVVNDNPGILNRLQKVGEKGGLLVFKPRQSEQPSTIEEMLGGQWTKLVDTTTSASTGDEFLLPKNIPLGRSKRVVFYGEIQSDRTGVLKATVSLFNNGSPVQLREFPLRLNDEGKPRFRSTEVKIPNIDADECRIYIWNPDRIPVRFQGFKISLKE